MLNLKHRWRPSRHLGNPNKNPRLKPILLAFLVFLTVPLFLFNHHRPQTNRDKWYISTSRIPITPQEPVWLSGFGWRRQPPLSNKTFDDIPLYARAVSIKGRKDPLKFVLVTLDLVGIDKVLSDRLFDNVWTLYGLERDRFKIVCSHTHSGPVVGRNLRVLAPDDEEELRKIRRYEQWLMQQILKVVGDVVNGKKGGDDRTSFECEAYYGVGENSIAVNRRQVKEKLFDGTTHGDIDSKVPVLHFRDKVQGKLVAVLYGYTAHATILSKTNVYSGDYPGAVSSLFEQIYPGSVAMFLPGAGGDQNIYPRGSKEYLATHAASLAATISTTILKSSKRLSKLSDDKIRGIHTFVRLPLRVARTRDELEQDLIATDANRAKLSRLILQDWKMEDANKSRATDRSYRYPICLWHVGNLRVLFMGGEPTVDYSFGMRKRGVDWVVGYSDDVMGYVGTRAVLKEGKREGSDRAAIYYGLVSAWKEDVEDILYNAVERLVGTQID